MSEEVQQFDLQSILRRTPEQIKEDEEAQETARIKFEHLLPNSAEKATYLHALGTEKDARTQIDSLLEGIRVSALDETKADVLKAAVLFYQSKLAESSFWQGKFADAETYEIREEQKHEYALYKQALDNIDSPLCDCPPIKYAGSNSAKGISMPSRREVQIVFVSSIEKSVKFIKCEKCEKLFAVSA